MAPVFPLRGNNWGKSDLMGDYLKFWGFKVSIDLMWYQEADGTTRPNEQIKGWIKVISTRRRGWAIKAKEAKALPRKFYMGGQLFYEVSDTRWNAAWTTYSMYLKHPILLPIAWTVRILENLRWKIWGLRIVRLPLLWCWITGLDSAGEGDIVDIKNFTFEGIKNRWRERAEHRKHFTWRTLFGFRIPPANI